MSILFNRKILAVIIGLIFFFTSQNGAQASSYDPYEIQTRLLFVQGPVFFASDIELMWRESAVNQSLANGEMLRTGNHGYAVVSWSDNNLIFVKPNTGLRFYALEGARYPLEVEISHGKILHMARESGHVAVKSRSGFVVTRQGETSFDVDSNTEIIKAVKGEADFFCVDNNERTVIKESYFLEFGPESHTDKSRKFDPNLEYQSFRRFSNWIKEFEKIHQTMSNELNFRISQVRVNGSFLGNMSREENGFYIIETQDGNIPDRIHLQFKIEPYPSINHRFELSLGKDLKYALREGENDYFEAIIEVPSIPEFLLAVHYIDTLGRKIRIFNAGFSVENRRSRIKQAREFCEKISQLFSRRDQTGLRELVSRDYRDWQGNTFFDFIKMTEDNLRSYTDVRLNLHPFRFEVKDGKTFVQLNYRFSALTNSRSFRYEKRGADTFILKREEGQFWLYSKASGLFFSRLNVAVDLRRGIIRGRVTDERTGRPLRDVSVRIRNTEHSTSTDSMGEYAFYNVDPGEYELLFHKNGYGNLTATRITVNPAGEQFR